MAKRKSVAIGCDPGTGVSSPLGLVAFDVATRELLFAVEFGTKYRKLQHRIKDISDRLEATLKDDVGDAEVIYFFVESFVMRGKGGETLQRMIGSVLGRLPYDYELFEVSNTKMKLLVGGHGHAGKEEVALGVLDFFEGSPSEEAIKQIVIAESFDTTDSLGIAIAGLYMIGSSAPQYEQQQQQDKETKAPSRTKTKPARNDEVKASKDLRRRPARSPKNK